MYFCIIFSNKIVKNSCNGAIKLFIKYYYLVEWCEDRMIKG